MSGSVFNNESPGAVFARIQNPLDVAQKYQDLDNSQQELLNKRQQLENLKTSNAYTVQQTINANTTNQGLGLENVGKRLAVTAQQALTDANNPDKWNATSIRQRIAEGLQAGNILPNEAPAYAAEVDKIEKSSNDPKDYHRLLFDHGIHGMSLVDQIHTMTGGYRNVDTGNGIVQQREPSSGDQILSGGQAAPQQVGTLNKNLTPDERMRPFNYTDANGATTQTTTGTMYDKTNGGGNQPAAMSGDDYAAKVNRGENSTGNAGAKNANSSATGNGQFIDSTWLQLMRQQHPEMSGKSDQEILAMRSDPKLSLEMTKAYGQQNAPILTHAGLPVDAATLSLAHRFGADGAVAVMNAPAMKPIEKVVGADVMKANPGLAGKTAGEVTTPLINQMGRQPVSFNGSSGNTGTGTGFSVTYDPNIVKNKGASSDQYLDASKLHQGIGDRTATLSNLYQDLSGADTGPKSQTIQNIKSFFVSQAPETLKKWGIVDPEKITNYDEAVKNFARYALAQSQGSIGIPSDMRTQLTQAATGSTDINNQAAKQIVLYSLGLERMRDAMFNEFQKKGGSVANSGNWTDFANDFSGKYDPRGFVAREMMKDNPQAMTKMYSSLSPDEKARMRASDVLMHGE